MRRQVIIGTVAGLVVVVAIGAVVLGSQQGIFSEKEKQLFTAAQREQKQGNVNDAQAKLEDLVTTSPESPWADDALLELALIEQKREHLMEARKYCRTLVERFPESPLLDRTQKLLGSINIALLFSPVLTEEDGTYVVKGGDTLAVIAKANATTVDYVKQANELKTDVIRPGQRLKVPKGTFAVVVDKSQRQLLLTRDGQFVKLYDIATGRENATPEGTFKIVNRIPDPVWYKQGAVVPQNSPENILGTRWMGFDKAGYGIHGTDDPGPIAQQQSAGCVRMVNSDVEELFSIVPIGTEVTIVN